MLINYTFLDSPSLQLIVDFLGENQVACNKLKELAI